LLVEKIFMKMRSVSTEMKLISSCTPVKMDTSVKQELLQRWRCFPNKPIVFRTLQQLQNPEKGLPQEMIVTQAMKTLVTREHLVCMVCAQWTQEKDRSDTTVLSLTISKIKNAILIFIVPQSTIRMELNVSQDRK
jgi:hypothetical protein